MLNAFELSRKSKTNRRGFLRGVGATLTLPWLESWPRSVARGAAETAEAPVRFACLFMANGVNVDHWWANGNGAEMQLGNSLKPLEPFKEDLNYIHGLYNYQATLYGGAHLGKIPNILSGAPISEVQSEIRAGKSMDQVVAQRTGQHTDIESLVLGIEPTELRLEDGLSMVYGSSISWKSATQPATKEIFPARAFDQLIDDRRMRRLHQSILDEVLEDSHRLRGRLSRGDQGKLEEYLESVRSIEKRIKRASEDGRLEGNGWKPTLAEPDIARPASELPQDVPTHMKLMLDIIILAFRMDKTRVATCMFNNDLSQMNMGFLDGVKGALHLDISHHGNHPVTKTMYQKSNLFHIQQYAYLIRQLKSVQEGDRTLLDNSIVMFCSSLMDGNVHDSKRIPFLLAGRAGGSLRTGRALNYFKADDENRRACSLHLSLMDHLGVHLKSFGDAEQRLAEF